MNETNPVANDAAPAIDYLALDQLVEERFNNDKENLIMILQAIQAEYNYLPQPALAYLSEKIEIPLSHIYGGGHLLQHLQPGTPGEKHH